ncbi:TPA: hypothetical protein L5D83_003152 [Pseudomonas aeruginosa]|nr:hypothetical protein [Pseudomonas aeruginosa]
MSLETKLNQLATAVGTDVKGILVSIGNLADLGITPTPASLVAALLLYKADIDGNTNSIGDLSALTTTAKSNLVAAINEVKSLIGQSGAVIDDNAGIGDTDVTWSADKSATELTGKLAITSKATGDDVIAGTDDVKYTTSKAVAAGIAKAVGDLVNGAPEVLDTLKELADALGNDPNYAATIAEALGKRVRVDAAQTFTTAEKLQGCQNLGVGDPEQDLVAVYNAAKA